MTVLNGLRLRVRALFRRKAVEAELDDELRFHLESQIEKYVQAGMTPEEAKRRAQIELGGLEQVKEECRDARGIGFFENTWRDVRYGARMLRKSPGFTLVAVLTLALGMGLNSTVFSLLNGLFFVEPPVRNPQRVFVVTLSDLAYSGLRIQPTPAEFTTWRENSGALSELAAADRSSLLLTGVGEPERLTIERVTPNYFRVLGASPAVGRGFTQAARASDLGHEVVISSGLWQREFGASPNIVGKSVLLSNRSYTVIGVMPDSIRYALGACDAWIPANISATSINPGEREQRRLEVIGRVEKGVPIARARTELGATEQTLARTDPSDEGLRINVQSLREFRTTNSQRGFAPILMGLTGMVLLVVCVNLGGLFLGRHATRRGEFAIRAALGASRRTTIRQLMFEALLLGLLGGGAALVASVWGAAVLRSVAAAAAARNPATVPSQIRVDHAVLLFTLCMSLLATLLFGLVPAIRGSRTDLNSVLKEGGQTSPLGSRRHWMRNSFVLAQVAMAVFLTIATGTMARSLFQQLIGPRGFDPQGVLAADVPLSGQQYDTATEQEAFFSTALQRIRNLPGVRFAAVTEELPVAHAQVVPFEVGSQRELNPALRPWADLYVVSPQYFKVMRIPLLRGRDFLSSDRQSTPNVVIISQVFAKRYFQNANPVGKHLRLFPSGTAEPAETTIVGVAGNVAKNPLRQHGLQIYEPFSQHPQADMTLVLRTSVDPASLAPSVRQSIWAINRNQPFQSLETLREVISQAWTGNAFLGWLLLGMDALVLFLAALGVYAVVAEMVAGRTQEIGLRMALGAQRKDIFRTFVLEGMLLPGGGLVLGLLAVAAIPRYLVRAFSPEGGMSLVLLAPFVILAATFLACYVPARRAMRVDPTEALRHE